MQGNQTLLRKFPKKYLKKVFKFDLFLIFKLFLNFLQNIFFLEISIQIHQSGNKIYLQLFCSKVSQKIFV